MFSYARNSCHRNHSRFTLCVFHFNENHPERWQDCPKCRDEIETEMYVYYATNEYNFEVLENPPDYEPTHCNSCGSVIVLADGCYFSSHDGYRCGKCTAAKPSISINDRTTPVLLVRHLQLRRRRRGAPNLDTRLAAIR